MEEDMDNITEEDRKKMLEKWAPLRDETLEETSRRFQIVIGAILSKQTQFSMVLKAIRTMKENKTLCPDGKSLNPEKLANFEWEALHRMISFVHYNKQKSKHIVAASKLIVERFRGVVPTQPDQTQLLPGIGPMLSSVIDIVG
ncbi:hypothetical protein AAMO2058_001318200 [Amorphochlora amoebiformis]